MNYYNPEYVKTNWKNEEDALSTPVIAQSLNNAENYIEVLDQRVSALSHDKADEDAIEKAIDQIEIAPSGIMTLHRLDGTIEDLYFYMLVPTMKNVKDAFDKALEDLQESSDDIISDFRLEAGKSEERIMEYVEDARSYASEAEGYRDDASDYEDIAKSWAIGNEPVRPGSSIDNAKYYAEQAKAISEGLVGTLRPKGTVYFSNLPALSSAKEGDMYNIANQFTTTSDFKEGAGVVVPEGSNVYKTSDNKWDVLAGSPVTGVKGKDEVTYRKGNVNITAENVGALPIEGGRLRGDLRLQGEDNSLYGTALLFGDGKYAYIDEDDDDHLRMYASNGIAFRDGGENYIELTGDEYGGDLNLSAKSDINILADEAVYIKAINNNLDIMIADGLELSNTALNKQLMLLYHDDGSSTFPATIHSHQNTTTYLNGNKGQAIINSLAAPNSYVMLDKLNSTNGYFTDGVWQGKRIFNYTAKSLVDANTNNVTKSVTILDESGNSSFPGTVMATAFSGIFSGNATSATKLATSRNIKTNLNSTSGANFDGSGDITPGITGTLPISNGGTGATTAEQARANLGIQTGDFLPAAGGTISGDLRLKGSKNYGNHLFFGDGEYVYFYEYEDDKLEIKASTLKLTSSNNIICNKPIAASITGNAAGLSETLPISKGGTGATTAEQARANLGITGGTSVNTVLDTADFNNIRTPGFYTVRAPYHQPTVNEEYGWGLIVVSTDTASTEELYQIAFLNNSYNTPNIFVRNFSDGSIGDWYKFNLTKA